MSTAVALLSANELTLSYGRQLLLTGVTLAVAPGEKVGLVGRNGSGKTSLLRILSGASEPDSGEISRRRGLSVGYLPQEFELDGACSVRENIEAGAADLLEWLRRYETGDGTPEELSARATGRVFSTLVSDAGLLDFGRRYRVTSRVRVLEGIQVRAIARPDEEPAGDPVEPNLEEAYLAEIDRAGR